MFPPSLSTHVSLILTQLPSHDFLPSAPRPVLWRELQHGTTSNPTFIHRAELVNQPQIQRETKLNGKNFSSDGRALEKITGAKSLKEIILVINCCITNYPQIWWFILLSVLWVRDSEGPGLGTHIHWVSRGAAGVGGPTSKLASLHTSSASLCSLAPLSPRDMSSARASPCGLSFSQHGDLRIVVLLLRWLSSRRTRQKLPIWTGSPRASIGLYPV